MIETLTDHEPTLADLLHRLGDVPVDRIMVNPSLGTASEADVLHYLEAPRKRLCELIDGVLVKKPMGAREGLLGAWIGRLVGNFVVEHDLGLVFGADAPFRFLPGIVRYPDVSFVSWDRVPDEQLPDDPIAGIVPDLAIEVLSPSNTEREMKLKLDHYFAAGVRLVWIIDPVVETASVYATRRRVKLLSADDELDGGKVLPGFRLSLMELFAATKRKKRRK